MAKKTKNKRNRYQSRYQLGGLQGGQGLPQTGRLPERRLPERLPPQGVSSRGLQGVPTNLNTIQRMEASGFGGPGRNIMQQQRARGQATPNPQTPPTTPTTPTAQTYKRPHIGGYKDPTSGQSGYWFTDTGEFLSDKSLEGVEDIGTDPRFRTTTKWWEGYDPNSGKLIRPGLNVQPPSSTPRQTGGMYSDNTVQAAGQGLRGSTSNIVYQEQDPKLQQQRLASQEEELSRIRDESKVTEQEVKQQEEQGKLDVQAEALKQQQKFAQGEMAAGALTKAAGMKSPTDLKGAALSGALKAYHGARAANLGSKLTQAGIAGAKGAKVASLAAKAGAFPMSSATTGKTIITGAGGNVIKGGSALGAGMKSFLSSGAGIGTVATLAGAGLKKWAADDDPTTADWGDVGGSALSAAGTGMAVGSMLGPVGTVVGGIGGALYGAGKSVFGAKKAKKEQEKYEAEIAEKKRKYSADVRKRFGTQGSAVRAGELRGKTYSGYDIGQNIMAQLGGMRMGIPRYGYAA